MKVSKTLGLGILLLFLVGTIASFTGLAAEDLLLKNSDDIKQLGTQVDLLNTKLTELGSEIVKLKSLITRMNQELGEIETSLSPAAEKIGALEGELQGKLRDLSGRVKELERDGKARALEINQENWMLWKGVSGGKILSNFVVRTDFKQVEGSPGYYGFLFRYMNKKDYYHFWVRDDSYYGLSLAKEDAWIDLVEMTYSEAIKRNQWNRLKVEASGEQIKLYANDRLLEVIEDESLSRGEIAVTAETSRGQDRLRVIFDNVSVNNLE